MIDVAVYPLHSCKDQVNMSLLSKVAERVREREREPKRRATDQLPLCDSICLSAGVEPHSEGDLVVESVFEVQGAIPCRHSLRALLNLLRMLYRLRWSEIFTSNDQMLQARIPMRLHCDLHNFTLPWPGLHLVAATEAA